MNRTGMGLLTVLVASMCLLACVCAQTEAQEAFARLRGTLDGAAAVEIGACDDAALGLDPFEGRAVLGRSGRFVLLALGADDPEGATSLVAAAADWSRAHSP